MVKPPFKLANDVPSHETVETLENLLDEARRGRIIGLAFVAMYKRRAYFANTTGEAYRNPTFARGMVCALDDYLSDLVRQSLRH